ncbi:Hint domain-containing protein [Roseibium sp. RKSG952]|uniref:Hint domain-containing protein n=1 Tax=Roseibium sp. RKSG952 TaxID=2529384 RepID=UPI0012BC39EB|nr:Hint domain-containing protein [Roseibium sp. RKSG952]MTI00525.1 calcium-binding protein [Roseibium sp. RKSG952]
MPNITGTNGADNIDVTDNNGTLNGTPQGTPIDDIRARGGADQINVTNSTISGSVRGNAGNDDITVSDSSIGGQLNAGRDDDTVNVQGSSIGNIRLGRGNDTLNFSSTNVSGDVRGGNGTDALNLPEGTVVNDSTFGTFTVVAGTSYSLSGGTFTLPSGITVTYSTFETGTGFVCFTRDTLILSERGPVRVQDLRTGDMIPTKGHGMQPLRWIGRRRFDTGSLEDNAKRRPVRILAGALGGGLPERDLLVSRQHRMLVQSKIAERMFGASDVLIPAIKLIALPGIFVDETVESVEYFHLLFDRHEIVFAEGAPSESLYTGPEALKSLSSEARREIFDIFPELAEMNYTPNPASYIPKGRQQAQLVARHLKNNKPLLQAI